MLWTTLFSLPILIVVGWLYTVGTAKGHFPTLKSKRICLLIAHPDDEAMFFAPALLALTNPALGNHVKILCLSSGDADGLGETRKKELVKSGMLLGLRREEDVFVVESPDFRDSMTTTWSKEDIASLLTSTFASGFANKPSSKSIEAATATIDVLITFDRAGVSSHPNHISLYHGARHFISTLTRNRSGWKSPIDLYTLSSVSIVRKYTSILDAFTSAVSVAFQKRSRGEHPSPLVLMSSPGEIRTAQKAMTSAHLSQMRWFRWGWIGLSRYMVLNDLHLEKVA